MSDGSAARVESFTHRVFDPAHHTWVRWLARFGYGARGVVYLLIGGLTIWAAITAREALGKKEAIRTLLDEPFGKPLLLTLLVGLVGYVLWRLIQSIGDTDDHGHSAKGLGVRAGLLASAGTYTLFGWYCLSLVVPGLGSGDGSQGALGRSRETFYGLLYNKWVALALGLVFLVVAGAHFWKAFKSKYAKHFVTDGKEMRFIHPVARTGLTARGIVLSIIGVLFASRFWKGDYDGDGAAPGLDDALAFVAGLPAGAWLLGALGVGLMLFAGYSILEAFYRRINVHEASAPVGGDGKGS